MALTFVYQHSRVHHCVNDCLHVPMNVYEYAKMNVDSLKRMYFHCNETDIYFIESIFSGNDQQKVYHDNCNFDIFMALPIANSFR